MTQKKIQRQITIDAELWETIQRMAQAEGRKTYAQIEWMLKKYLEGESHEKK